MLIITMTYTTYKININETFEDLVEEIDKVHSKLDVNNSGIIVKNKLYKGNSKNGCC